MFPNHQSWLQAATTEEHPCTCQEIEFTSQFHPEGADVVGKGGHCHPMQPRGSEKRHVNLLNPAVKAEVGRPQTCWICLTLQAPDTRDPARKET